MNLETLSHAGDPADALRAEQMSQWRRGQRTPVEALLKQASTAPSDDEILDLIYGEVVAREELGEAPRLEEYLERFPRFAEPLRRQFAVHRLLASPEWSSAAASAGRTVPVSEGQASAPPAPPGYTILGELGRGGMGVVYKARHVALDRLTALKVIRAEQGREEERARFRTEAEAAARLQHPNVVQIYEVGERAGRPYVALEFVDGGSLADRLRSGPLPPRLAAELLVPLARAVHYAHQRQVIHRDLKPANVLLTADGAPKIADFGLAKKLDDVGQTSTGAVMGTPSYMAPEQAEGRNQAVGPATDVYALGAVLYEMLTARPPFRGDSALETVRQVAKEEPVPPGRLQPRTPRDLETICLKCLRKDPRRRYASADELAADLTRFLAGEPIQARPTPPWERAVKWARRRPTTAALFAACTLAAAVLIAVWIAFTVWLQEAKQAADKSRADAVLAGKQIATERDAADKARADAVEANKQTVAQRDAAMKQADRAEEILNIMLAEVQKQAQESRTSGKADFQTGNSGGVVFALACSYARSSSAFASDEKLTPEDRSRLKEQFATLAVKLLECAAKVKYFDHPENRKTLDADPNLDPLRARPDYRDFRAGL